MKTVIVFVLLLILSSCSSSFTMGKNTTVKVSKGELQQILHLNELLSSIKTTYYKTRTVEKDLLLRNSPAYIKKFEKSVSDLLDLLNEYDTLQRDISTQTDTILILSEQYRTSFREVIELKMIQGMDNRSGLTGELRRAAYELHNSIENSAETEHINKKSINIQELKINNQLLQIRRREKDYLLRGLEKYLSQVNAQCDSLKTIILASSSERQKTVLPQIENYRKAVDRYHDNQKAIQKSIEKLRGTIHKLEPVIYYLYDENYYRPTMKMINSK